MTAFPRLIFEAAFTTDPLDDTPVYTDLSARLTGDANADIGVLTRLLGRAGTATLILDNSDGAFNGWDTSSPYYGNLLTANQASVETDTTGLTARSNCTISRSTAQAADGAASLQMTVTALAAAQAGTPTGTGGTPVVGGRQYTGVIFFRAAAGYAPSFQVVIDWYRADGSYVTTDRGGFLSVTDSDWRYASVTAAAPADAAYAALSGYSALLSAGEVIYLDKLGLFGGADPTWSPGGRAGNVQPMVKVRVGAQYNLLTANQASVETDTTGLTARSNCTISRSTAQAADGAASLQMTVTALAAAQAGTPTGTGGTPVVGGRQYTGVIFFRAAAGYAPSFQVVIDWYRADGSYVTTDRGGFLSVTDSDWRYASVTAAAPTDAAYAALSGYSALLSAGEVIYLDKLGLFDGADPAWSRGGPYYLFTGYAEDWAAEWESLTSGNTAVRVVDGHKITTLGKQARGDYRAAQLANTPAGLYALNETGRSSAVNGLITAVDSSGNGRDALYKGSPAGYETAGALPAEVGTAVDFGIRQGWVEMPISVIAAGTGDFTIEGWAFIRSIQSQPFPAVVDRIWHAIGVGSQSLYLTLGRDGKLQFVATAGTDGGVLPATTAVTLGRWNHIAAVKTGTTGPGNWRIYLNAVDVSDHAAQTVNGTGNVSVTSNASLLAGYEAGAASQGALDGLVDEFAIYPVALTAGQVAAHYAAGFGLVTQALTGARVGQLLNLLGFPAADRTIDAGQFQMQPIAESLYDTPLFGLFERLVESEGWPSAWFFDGKGYAVFQDRAHATPASSATFSDTSAALYFDPGPGPHRPDDHVWTRVILQADNGAAKTAEDTTAARRYVGRTLTRTGLKNASDADVTTMTASELARWKTPRDRIEQLVIHPVDEPGNMWPQVLGRELNDVITVQRTALPGGGAPFTGQFRIAGITHTFTAEDWHTTWQLEPA